MNAQNLPDLVGALLERPGPLTIVQAGDPVLRRPAEPYEGQLDDELLERLIEAMRETMHAAPGVGLAAPQVGIPLRIAVLEDAGGPPGELSEARERGPLPFRVLVNPAYEPVGDRRSAFYEGCLSVPGWQAVVSRPTGVRLSGLDERGRPLEEEVTGWPARIVQHETDHLGGTLYLDRAEIRSLASNDHVLERWSQPYPHLAAGELGFSVADG